MNTGICMNHIRIPAILKVLEEDPMMSKQVADRLQLSVVVTLKYIRRARNQNLIHISAWDWQSPIYKYGPGIDAKKDCKTDEELLVERRSEWRLRQARRLAKDAENEEKKRKAAEMYKGHKACWTDPIFMVLA